MIPSFSLAVDGQDITDMIASRLIDLSVTDEAGYASDTVTLNLADPDGALETPRKGVKLKVALGYNGLLIDQGLFTVDEVSLSGPPFQLSIGAKGADFRETLKTNKTRNWQNVSAADLVRKIAAEHQLKPAVSPAMADLQFKNLAQTNESDLHLLTRLGRGHGAVVKPANGHLVFVEKGQARSATGRVMPTVTLGPHDLSTWSVSLGDRERYSKVEAPFTDTKAGTVQKFAVGKDGPTLTLNGQYPSEAEAQSAAKAKLASLKRGEGKISLNLPGRPDICAESKIILVGVRDGVDGEWLITRAEHQLSNGGLTTSLEGEVPH